MALATGPYVDSSFVPLHVGLLETFGGRSSRATVNVGSRRGAGSLGLWLPACPGSRLAAAQASCPADGPAGSGRGPVTRITQLRHCHPFGFCGGRGGGRTALCRAV